MPPAAPERWCTPANLLTGLRLAAAPATATAIATGAAGVALGLFALAVASDLADGPLARHRDEASALGGLLDHATDATYVSLGLAACAWSGLVPAWLPLLVAASFVQYVLDSRALRGQRLRASGLGRANGVAYFVLLGVPVVRDGLGLGWPPDAWIERVGWGLVATTLVSMGERALVRLRTPRGR